MTTQAAEGKILDFNKKKYVKSNSHSCHLDYLVSKKNDFI